MVQSHRWEQLELLAVEWAPLGRVGERVALLVAPLAVGVLVLEAL